jgi:hypothetical protein
VRNNKLKSILLTASLLIVCSPSFATTSSAGCEYSYGVWSVASAQAPEGIMAGSRQTIDAQVAITTAPSAHAGAQACQLNFGTQLDAAIYAEPGSTYLGTVTVRSPGMNTRKGMDAVGQGSINIASLQPGDYTVGLRVNGQDQRPSGFHLKIVSPQAQSHSFNRLLEPNSILSEMKPGESLRMVGSDGIGRITFQVDGNLVYTAPNGSVLMSTGSNNLADKPGKLIMQADGNLVIYSVTGVALWHTHSWMYPGAIFGIADGNRFVVYDPNKGSVYWQK